MSNRIVLCKPEYEQQQQQQLRQIYMISISDTKRESATQLNIDIIKSHRLTFDMDTIDSIDLSRTDIIFNWHEARNASNESNGEVIKQTGNANRPE